MSEIPTIKVKNPNSNGDFMVINVSDFDKKIHTPIDGAAPVIEPQASEDDWGTDSGNQFSDAQLRDAIETATGSKPHHKTGRDKLIATFNTLNSGA